MARSWWPVRVGEHEAGEVTLFSLNLSDHERPQWAQSVYELRGASGCGGARGSGEASCGPFAGAAAGMQALDVAALRLQDIEVEEVDELASSSGGSKQRAHLLSRRSGPNASSRRSVLAQSRLDQRRRLAVDQASAPAKSPPPTASSPQTRPRMLRRLLVALRPSGRKRRAEKGSGHTTGHLYKHPRTGLTLVLLRHLPDQQDGHCPV